MKSEGRRAKGKGQKAVGREQWSGSQKAENQHTAFGGILFLLRASRSRPEFLPGVLTRNDAASAFARSVATRLRLR